MEHLSDNALLLWMAHFMNPRNTLTFGGDHAEMEITTEARKALDELLAVGAVVPAQPQDQWPGRECYRGTEVNLKSRFKDRPHLNPFSADGANLVTFRKKSAGQPPTPSTDGGNP